MLDQIEFETIIHRAQSNRDNRNISLDVHQRSNTYQSNWFIIDGSSIQ